MTRIFVGPSTLCALGSVGEVDLLTHFDGALVIPEIVVDEVTTEPARTALATFLEETDVTRSVPESGYDRATTVLGVEPDTYEAAILGGVIADAETDDRRAVAVLSEDRRVRLLADGLGATVSSSIGVIVRAAREDKYFSPSQAKRVVRRIDERGPAMTGAMHERVLGAIEG